VGSDTHEAIAIRVSVPVATATAIVASVIETPIVQSRQFVFTDDSPTFSPEALLSVKDNVLAPSCQSKDSLSAQIAMVS